MNEEEIIATICDAIQDRLGNANVSRNFLTQTLLPQVSAKTRSDEATSKKSGKYQVHENSALGRDSHTVIQAS